MGVRSGAGTRDQVEGRVRVKVLLEGQGGRYPRDPIGVLVGRHAGVVVDPDEVAWMRALVRPGRRTDAPAAMVAHLRALPHLAYDGHLSLAVARLRGDLDRDELRATAFAGGLGWRLLADGELDARVADHVERVCSARAEAPSSPTHGRELPASRAESMLFRDRWAPRNPRATGRDPGRTTARDDGIDLADAKAGNHRNRINRRIERLVALADMVMGRVGRRAPMVSDRVLDRHLEKRVAFEGGPGRRRVAVAARGNGTATASVSELAEAARRDAHDWSVEQVNGAKALQLGDPETWAAFHVRLGLTGALCDPTRAGTGRDDIPFTPADGADVLSAIIGQACARLTCCAFCAFDATERGFPHLHATLVIRRDQWETFRRRIVSYYRKYGMTVLAGKRGRGLFFHRALSGHDGGWAYPVRKLRPATGGGPRDDPGIRLAAWRQAHGIPRAPIIGFRTLAVPRALARVPSGRYPVVDGLIAAGPGHPRRGAAMRAMGGATRLGPGAMPEGLEIRRKVVEVPREVVVVAGPTDLVGDHAPGGPSVGDAVRLAARPGTWTVRDVGPGPTYRLARTATRRRTTVVVEPVTPPDQPAGPSAHRSDVSAGFGPASIDADGRVDRGR